MDKLKAVFEKIVSGAGLARATYLEALQRKVRVLESGPVGGPG